MAPTAGLDEKTRGVTPSGEQTKMKQMTLTNIRGYLNWFRILLEITIVLYIGRFREFFNFPANALWATTVRNRSIHDAHRDSDLGRP